MSLDLPALPEGSDRIAAWAAGRRFGYDPRPNEPWFRGWEPYDTMTSPGAWFNSVAWPLPLGRVTVAEPWMAPTGAEPLDRTLLAFITHPGFRRRAAARGGEHFNTRVTFLESPPPPRVELGDPDWDRHMLTFAASASEAVAAFPIAARRLLAQWGFAGHLEVRPGGLVVHFAGSQPTAEALDRLLASLPTLVTSFVG